jgi:hypothetical protein
MKRHVLHQMREGEGGYIHCGVYCDRYHAVKCTQSGAGDRDAAGAGAETFEF